MWELALYVTHFPCLLFTMKHVFWVHLVGRFWSFSWGGSCALSSPLARVESLPRRSPGGSTQFQHQPTWAWLIVGIEQDAYTYSWTPDCQAQFGALVSVSGVPYKSPPSEVSEDFTHCDEGCCPEDIHVPTVDMQVDIVVEDHVWSSPTWGTQ